MPRQKKDAKILNIKLNREIHEMLVCFCDETGMSKTVATEKDSVSILRRVFR